MPGLVPSPLAERALLLSYLEQQRAGIRNTTHGLSDAEASRRPSASALSLAGLVKHAAKVEQTWISYLVDADSSVFVPDEDADWSDGFRLVRGETLTIRVREYVQAARVSGVRNGTIIARHVVRNVVGTIVVQTTFEVANAILLLAALGYLGLGPPPPAANWGAMLSDGLNYVYAGYWWLIYPAGVAIILTVVCFNYLGDALRDAFEVRLQDR